MDKVRVAIFGASGYSGEELLRLLRRHPNVELTAITSRQYAGQQIASVFPKFFDDKREFVAPDVDNIAAQADLAFLALPHGLAAEYAAPLLERGLKVIDISADFRLRNTTVYKAYYKQEHPAPDLLERAVFGLPERYRERLRTAQLVANPGCYVTSILLAVCPLLAASVVRPTGIICASLSGVSGAGRKTEVPYLFSECNESLRPYSVVGHRHTPEIEQELALAAGVDSISIVFTPHLVPVTRGIHSSIYLEPQDHGFDAAGVLQVLYEAYQDEPFVRVLPLGRMADTKNVVMTNMCEIACAYDQRNNRIILSSAIDNLTKGAAGQAIQNMNLVCGLEETAGLLC